MTTNEILEKEIEKLRAENKIMREIATPVGFFSYYFKMLKEEKFTTNVSCFNYVNDLYFNFFGEYKYSDYNSFRLVQNKNIKK